MWCPYITEVSIFLFSFFSFFKMKNNVRNRNKVEFTSFYPHGATLQPRGLKISPMTFPPMSFKWARLKGTLGSRFHRLTRLCSFNSIPLKYCTCWEKNKQKQHICNMYSFFQQCPWSTFEKRENLSDSSQNSKKIHCYVWLYDER